MTVLHVSKYRPGSRALLVESKHQVRLLQSRWYKGASTQENMRWPTSSFLDSACSCWFQGQVSVISLAYSNATIYAALTHNLVSEIRTKMSFLNMKLFWVLPFVLFYSFVGARPIPPSSTTSAPASIPLNPTFVRKSTPLDLRARQVLSEFGSFGRRAAPRER